MNEPQLKAEYNYVNLLNVNIESLMSTCVLTLSGQILLRLAFDQIVKSLILDGSGCPTGMFTRIIPLPQKRRRLWWGRGPEAHVLVELT